MIVAVPPGRSMPERLLRRRLQADRLEGVVDAAAGHLLDRLDRVGVDALTMSVAPNCCATSSFGRRHVDRDDARRARRCAAPLIADSPMPPQPITATVRAGLDLGGVEHRADAGRHAAADQRGAVQRHVVADLHHRVLVHQHLLGEGAERCELLVSDSPFLRQPARARPAAAHLGALAERRVAGQALRAVAAEDRQAGDDVVARLHVGDVVAHRLDDAGALVAEHRRQAGTGRGPR